MITIYHNPRCRKSRESLELLKDSGETFEIREYLKEPPTREELMRVLKKLSKSPQELIRKGESIYKEKFREGEYTDAEWIEILVDHPILIERPIVIKGNRAVIGRPADNLKELLQS